MTASDTPIVDISTMEQYKVGGINGGSFQRIEVEDDPNDDIHTADVSDDFYEDPELELPICLDEEMETTETNSSIQVENTPNTGVLEQTVEWGFLFIVAAVGIYISAKKLLRRK